MSQTLKQTEVRAGYHQAAAIPFVDLAAAHRSIRAELDAAIAGVLDDSAFVGGPRVEAFEREFAALCGTRHAVAVANGTDALRIALQCAGVRAGDVVITVSMTFFATTEAILQLGAVPLFVDIHADSCCMDADALARVLERDCRREGDRVVTSTGARVAAILPVHLYGLPAATAEIERIADAWGLPVVEDAAQAHGALARCADGSTRPCGGHGLLAAFSFYPSKNLGALGEAGAITTDDANLAERARSLREHGQRDRYHHEYADGGNARMDGLQAAVLSVKLRSLASWTEQRRAVAAVYDEAFDAAGVARQGRSTGVRGHVYHLYVVEVDDRAAVRDRLLEAGIATGIHYPVPVHAQPAMRSVPALVPEPLAATERLAERCLSLPMYPGLSRDAAGRVAEVLLEVTGRS